MLKKIKDVSVFFDLYEIIDRDFKLDYLTRSYHIGKDKPHIRRIRLKPSMLTSV